MPTYNGASYVETALASVASEADDGIEVVAIDDGSTDETPAILDRFAHELPMRIEQERRGNWVAATNRGLELAGGTYVSFLHQDDYWLPNRARLLREQVRKHSPDFLLHPVIYVDATGRRVGSWNCPLPGWTDLEPDFVVERLLVQNFISAPAPLFSLEAAVEVGGMDERLWHTADWDFWLKLAGRGRTRYIPQPLAAYRVHESALSMTRSEFTDDFRGQLESVLNPHLEAWRRNHPKSAALEAAARFSVDTNVALAALSHRQRVRTSRLLAGSIRLGPLGWRRYLRDSRIIERAGSRIRARSRRRPGSQARS